MSDRKHIWSIEDFFLNENTNIKVGTPAWPYDWKDMDEWKILSKWGYTESTTSGQARNDTIMIDVPGVSIAGNPGYVLQKSGYIRRKGAKSGFIRRDMHTLKEMLQYLIKVHAKETGVKEPKLVKEVGGISKIAQDYIAKSTRSAWEYSPGDDAVHIKGNFVIDLSSPAMSEMRKVNIGSVGNTLTIEKGNIESFSDIDKLMPEVVGKNLKASGIGLRNLKGSPRLKDSWSGTYDYSNNRISTLEGLSEKTGDDYLGEVNLSGNLLERLQPIDELTYVKSIDLSNNKLKTLTDLKKLKKARSNDEKPGFWDMDLRDNDLITLEGIENIIVRNRLYISGNPLVSLSYFTPEKGGFNSDKFSVIYDKPPRSMFTFEKLQYLLEKGAQSYFNKYRVKVEDGVLNDTYDMYLSEERIKKEPGRYAIALGKQYAENPDIKHLIDNMDLPDKFYSDLDFSSNFKQFDLM